VAFSVEASAHFECCESHTRVRIAVANDGNAAVEMIRNHFAEKPRSQTATARMRDLRAFPAIRSKHQVRSSIVHVHFLLQKCTQQLACLCAFN
jgi:hypothetical protein